jgi:hypothetical protein
VFAVTNVLGALDAAADQLDQGRLVRQCQSLDGRHQLISVVRPRDKPLFVSYQSEQGPALWWA